MSEYQVLARKYRPKKLSELIGQDVLVRTLGNAIAQNRIPHAFILTGIRGVGKTSTARIIARSLLCTGIENNQQNPTIEPCGKCTNCLSISADNHIDVVEVDAASRTGVSDIREIIDQVVYAPVMGRCKIYIIDEVHMLSKSALNALLKTLEEPPSHVKFIFTTTEVKKIPVTIISRCMRFDLPRVPATLLVEHFQKISEIEDFSAEEEALKLIAVASEGSVRDGLSLLDQAIAVSTGEKITAEKIRQMLGLADKENIFNLIEKIVEGNFDESLKILNNIYSMGADAGSIIRNMLETMHEIALRTASPKLFDEKILPEFDLKRIKDISSKTSFANITRLWQILAHGIEGLRICSDSLMAAEMVILRAVYASSLPTTEEIIEKLEDPSDSNLSFNLSTSNVVKCEEAQKKTLTDSYKPELQQQPEINTDKKKLNFDVNLPLELKDFASQLRSNGENMLAALIESLKVVSFNASGTYITLQNFVDNPLFSLSGFTSKLNEVTGKKWQISIDSSLEGKSILQNKEEELEKRKNEAINSPKLKLLIENFEGAEIISVTEVRE